MNFKLDLNNMINTCTVDWYQEHCRIYMDEYPDVEEVDVLARFDTKWTVKRFMVKE